MAVATEQEGAQLSGGLLISLGDAAFKSVKSPILPKAPELAPFPVDTPWPPP